MDNLNLHGANALIRTLGATQGAALWARFTPHYTPKHGSWLNPAEIEASLWSRECHGRDRVDSFEALRDRTRAWTAAPTVVDEDSLAIYDRQGTPSLSLPTAEHYVAVEALERLQILDDLGAALSAGPMTPWPCGPSWNR